MKTSVLWSIGTGYLDGEGRPALLDERGSVVAFLPAEEHRAKLVAVPMLLHMARILNNLLASQNNHANRTTGKDHPLLGRVIDSLTDILHTIDGEKPHPTDEFDVDFLGDRDAEPGA